MKLSELKGIVDRAVEYQAKHGNDPEVWYFDGLMERASRVTTVATLEARSLDDMCGNLQFVSETNIPLPESELPFANHPLFLITDTDPDYLN